MGNNRNSALDYIRVLALMGIVLDYSLMRFSGVLNAIGLWLGGVNVTIFFALSAFLFGAKWLKSQYESFDAWPFLEKRVLRIYIPLWIVLLAIIPIEYNSIHQLDIKTVFINSLGLCCAKPFGAGGHLWYITMMMILYIAFIVFSHFRLDKCSVWIWAVVLCCIVLVYGLFPTPFMTFSHAGPPLFIWLASLLFFKGKELIDIVERYHFISLSVSTVLAVGSWLLYICIPNWHFLYSNWATLTTSLVGAVSFVVLVSIIRHPKEISLVKHLAGISYEYYLCAYFSSSCGLISNSKQVAIIAHLATSVLGHSNGIKGGSK